MALRATKMRHQVLASDQREFDSEVVRSSLDFYNFFWSAESKIPRHWNVRTLPERFFGWVPPVMELRAERDDIDPANVRWHAETIEQVDAASYALLGHVCGFKSMLEQQGYTRFNRRYVTMEQWLNEILASLPIYSRYKSEDGQMRFVSVPLLTGVQQCVAYAIALIKLDRHDFVARVRPCEFLSEEQGPPLPGHHYFLADDLRQKCCTPAHANRLRQRRYRAQQETA